jgi:hypothetical protein
MRSSWILVVACLLPGCAALSTDCSQERAELRATESAISYASRQHKAEFSAKLVSRGHTNYHCVSGRSGQVRCTKAPVARSGPDLAELHHKRDASLARIAKICR